MWWQGDSLDENVSACVNSLFSTNWDDKPNPLFYTVVHYMFQVVRTWG